MKDYIIMGIIVSICFVVFLGIFGFNIGIDMGLEHANKIITEQITINTNHYTERIYKLEKVLINAGLGEPY